QVANDLLHGCHAVAGVDAVRVGDLVARRILGIVIHVEDVVAGARNQTQTIEVTAALVDVIQVGEDAGPGMAALDGNEIGLGEPARALGQAPDLQHGDAADLLAGIEQGAIALGGAVEVEVRLVGSAGRRGRHATTAQLANHIHGSLGFFHALGPAAVVIDD